MKPLVEIVLINYNGYEDTVECIKSLKQITYENYIIVVVDNASTLEPTEEEIDFIRKNSIFIKCEENKGFAGGNNYGIFKTSYLNPDYYLLLNNDTIVTKDFLDKLVEVAIEKDDTGIVCGKICYFSNPSVLWFAGGTFNPKTCVVTNAKLGRFDQDSSYYIEPIEFATGCLNLIPHNVWKSVGPMEEQLFLYCEDTDLSRKIRNKGYSIYYRNDAKIYHKVSRSTGANSENTQYYTVRNELYIIKMYSNNKMFAYFYKMVHLMVDIIKRRKRIKPVVEAFSDFYKSVYGKRRT